MSRLRVPTTLALCLAWLCQPLLADTELTLHAEETRTEVLQLQHGRIRLPSLQFSVHARFNCKGEAVAESITISVADALERYVPQQGDEALEALITIPGNQIAAVATGDFCVDGGDGGELLLTGAATAQVSLRCRDERGSSIRYASLRLPVRLVCKQDEIQEPSADVSSAAR